LLERLAPGHDPSLWAWDLRFLPPLPRLGSRLLAALAFGWVALGRERFGQLRPVALSLVGAMAIVAMKDVANTLGLQRTGALPGGLRWPFSGWVALGCAAAFALGWSRPKASAHRPGWIHAARALGLLAGVGLWAALFARGQMICFGETDYRGDPHARPADGIVIFGARAYANGAPSPALRYRVERALELYQQGFAPRLYLSGGPGDGEFHEVDVMSAILTQHGVPDSALIRDEGGWSTQLTVDHAAEHFGPRAELLAVSQAFHLPRIELTFARAGLDVRTVPAQDSRYPWVRQRNANRETLALGWYALRPLLGR
jgi:vancomycin permeability regulator SanA